MGEYDYDDFEDDFEPPSPQAPVMPAPPQAPAIPAREEKMKPPDDARSAGTRASTVDNKGATSDVEEDADDGYDFDDFEDSPDNTEANIKSAPELIERIEVGSVEYDYAEDNEYDEDLLSEISREASIEDNVSIQSGDD